MPLLILIGMMVYCLIDGDPIHIAFLWGLFAAFMSVIVLYVGLFLFAGIAQLFDRR